MQKTNNIISIRDSFKHSEIKNDKLVEKKLRIPNFGNKSKSQEDSDVLAVISITKSKMNLRH